MADTENRWADVAAPIVQKLEVASVFGSATTFNRIGSASLARFIKQVAAAADKGAAVQRRSSRIEIAMLIGGFGCGAAIFGEGWVQSIGLGMAAFAYVYEWLERRREG